VPELPPQNGLLGRKAAAVPRQKCSLRRPCVGMQCPYRAFFRQTPTPVIRRHCRLVSCARRNLGNCRLGSQKQSGKIRCPSPARLGFLLRQIYLNPAKYNWRPDPCCSLSTPPGHGKPTANLGDRPQRLGRTPRALLHGARGELTSAVLSGPSQPLLDPWGRREPLVVLLGGWPPLDPNTDISILILHSSPLLPIQSSMLLFNMKPHRRLLRAY